MVPTQGLVGTGASAVPSSAAARFARWGGVLYASAGIVGLALTGFDDLTSTSGASLVIFEVNGLQNLLHLAVGVALVSASAGPEAARLLTTLTAVAFGVAGLLGLALVGTDANVLALNAATNIAHLVTAAGATVCAVASSRRGADR
jgi:hypothetical protein